VVALVAVVLVARVVAVATAKACTRVHSHLG